MPYTGHMGTLRILVLTAGISSAYSPATGDAATHRQRHPCPSQETAQGYQRHNPCDLPSGEMD